VVQDAVKVAGQIVKITALADVKQNATKPAELVLVCVLLVVQTLVQAATILALDLV
jgi:hypothetical protein